MIKLRAYLAYGIKKIWTLLALLLVVSAVAISLLRFSLPYLDKNKHLVEDYIAQHYAAELEIGSISATWMNIGPSLVLNSVALKDSSSNALRLNVDRVYVEVDFWQSLKTLSLQSNRFELRGVELDVNTHLMTTKSDQTNVVTMVTNLFFERLQHFFLTDSKLTINTEHNSQTYALKSVQWRNQGNRHQAVGEMRVAQLANNSASFVLDLKGDTENLSGQFYAEGDALDLSPWFNEFISDDQTLLNSQGNFKVWAHIEQSEVSGVQAEILPSQFEWQSAEETIMTTVQNGQIVAEPSAQGWLFNINDLVLLANEQSVTTNFTGSIDHSGNLNLSSMDNISLSPLLALVPLIIDAQQSQVLSQINPKGKVTNLALQSRSGGVTATAKLQDLSWEARGNLPGLSNLAADFAWYKNQGRLGLTAENAVLATKGLLDESLDLSHFVADFYLYTQASIDDSKAEDWFVYSDNIEFDSDKVSFTQQLNFDIGNQHLLLATQIDSLPVAQIPDLFPSDYMGVNTKAYLTRALSNQAVEDNATVESANLIWQGALDAFPFADNQGVFQASVDITNARFLFSNEWPTLTNLDINLLFENDSLLMRSDSSQLQSISLTDLEATIPSLSNGEILEIKAVGAGQGSAVAMLMNASQMSSSLGTLLSDDIQVSGPIEANLGLSIPLNAEQVEASGIVSLKDNYIRIPSIGIEFQQANGQLFFVNDAVNFERVTAKLLNQSVELRFEGEGSEKGYQAHVGIQGNLDLDQLLGEYSPALDSYVDGFTSVEAEIDLLLTKGEFEYAAILHSPFNRTLSRLPTPFNIDEQTLLPLWVNVTGNKTASIIDLTLGTEIAFSGVLPHAESQFSRAHLAIAEEPTISLGVGFSISADVAELDLKHWYQTLKSLGNDAQQNEHDLLGSPERLFINAQKMTMDGNILENVRFVGKQKYDDWDLDLSAKQLKAQVFIPGDYLSRGIEVNADFLRMESFGSIKSDDADWKPKNIPPFRFRCAQCQLGRFDLGKVNIDAVKNSSGLSFDRIEMESANGKLTAEGLWQFNSEVVNTALSGELNSTDFGQFLKQMGFDSGIKDSRANFEFVLNWPDSPWALAPEDLQGEVDWSLTDGYLTEISDQGSRIFTLFSLNSLVRKLSLDFRDVFAQGFFYDDIEGTLQIADGKAYTDDTIVDGGAGEITINGYTDLAKNKLNYRVSFTPNVTGNLPVLVYFMVNPPTALAALALDQVLTSAKVISNVNYSVTGTIDKPVVSEIGRDSADVELPARVPPIDEPVVPGSDTGFVPPMPISVDAAPILDGAEDG